MQASKKVLMFSLLMGALLHTKPASAFLLSDAKNVSCRSERGQLLINRRSNAAVLNLKGFPLYTNGKMPFQKPIFVTPNAGSIKLGSELISADLQQRATVFLQAGLHQNVGQSEKLPVAIINNNGLHASFEMDCTLIN